MERDGAPAERPPRIPGFVWFLLAIPFLFLLVFVPWRRLRGGPPREFTNSIGMKFVRVEPGDFLMGSPEGEEEREENETPHRVKIARMFFLQTTEVTQKQWRAVMGTDPSDFEDEDLPVENVSWDDAAEFCKKLGAKEGNNYRLPTEAEWEYACRAGLPTEAAPSTAKAGTRGPYGGTGKVEEMGWHGGNSEGKTHAVGQKRANGWGLYDMHGNVFEWCGDLYSEYLPAPLPAATAQAGPGQAGWSRFVMDDWGPARVLRGGCWARDPRFCRSASRSGVSPSARGSFIGFRAAMDF